MPVLNDIFGIIKEAVKNRNFDMVGLQNLYDNLKKFREYVRRNQKLSADAEMLSQVNAILNGIQKKEIEDICLEGQEGLRRGELYRFVLEDREGSRLMKYFAIGNIDSHELRFVRVCFERELLLCANYKTDESAFLNLYEGTYNEFNVIKTAADFI